MIRELLVSQHFWAIFCVTLAFLILGFLLSLAGRLESRASKRATEEKAARERTAETTTAGAAAEKAASTTAEKTTKPAAASAPARGDSSTASAVGMTMAACGSVFLALNIIQIIYTLATGQLP
jgi:hypothetical protein